jgi:hypothetical protein
MQSNIVEGGAMGVQPLGQACAGELNAWATARWAGCMVSPDSPVAPFPCGAGVLEADFWPYFTMQFSRLAIFLDARGLLQQHGIAPALQA